MAAIYGLFDQKGRLRYVGKARMLAKMRSTHERLPHLFPKWGEL